MSSIELDISRNKKMSHILKSKRINEHHHKIAHMMELADNYFKVSIIIIFENIKDHNNQ